eukprot:365080-Chlamydomonas_euryale.AAC.12
MVPEPGLFAMVPEPGLFVMVPAAGLFVMVPGAGSDGRCGMQAQLTDDACCKLLTNMVWVVSQAAGVSLVRNANVGVGRTPLLWEKVHRRHFLAPFITANGSSGIEHSCLRWMSIRPPMVPVQVKGPDVPTARTGQAVTSIREKMFVFGGTSAGGGLTNDLWTFDLDTVKVRSCQKAGIESAAHKNS